MEIRIYQIDMDRDTNRVCYLGLESLEKFQGSYAIDSSRYDKIYEGTVNCRNLEQIFEMFNLNHPAEFHGHSLSVSDIVEVVEGGHEKPGFYFCDSIGFEPVPFDANRQSSELTDRAAARLRQMTVPLSFASVQPTQLHTFWYQFTVLCASWFDLWGVDGYA